MKSRNNISKPIFNHQGDAAEAGFEKFVASRIELTVEAEKSSVIPYPIDSKVMETISNSKPIIGNRIRTLLWSAAVAASLALGVTIGNMAAMMTDRYSLTDELPLLDDMEMENYDSMFNY
jgi:hypothetical protein